MAEPALWKECVTRVPGRFLGRSGTDEPAVLVELFGTIGEDVVRVLVESLGGGPVYAMSGGVSDQGAEPVQWHEGKVRWKVRSSLAGTHLHVDAFDKPGPH